MKVVSTFHAPSSVICSLRTRLTVGQEHLVVGKADLVEVYAIEDTGLKLIHKHQVWGSVVSIRAVPLRVSLHVFLAGAEGLKEFSQT